MTSLDDRLRRPALVAALCDPNGVVQGVEVTLLSTHGSANAPVATPRRVIGTLIGGAVQLDIVDETLLVAEGVATTLSAAQVFDLPAWALLTAYNLACFTPPARVRRLVVAADRDKAGLRAASALAERVDPLLEVEIAPPPAGFGDWNDFIRAG